MKLKDLKLVYIKGKPPKIKEGQFLLPYLTPEYIRSGAAPEYYPKQEGVALVEDGDLILLWDGSNAGEFFKGKRGILSSTMVKITPIVGTDDDYIFYSLKLQEPSLKSKTAGTGIPHVDKEALFNLEIFLPEKKHQTTIATALTTIDQSIEKTEQLIAKYERIKNGLMQGLLTRGIDEQGNIRSEDTHEFKNSLLGRIPVGWDVMTLKAACEKIQDGTHFSPEMSEVGEFLYITSKNIRIGELDLRNVELITREAHESIYRRCSVEFGDVLLTKDGANTGNVCLNTIKQPISLLSSVAFLRGKRGILKNEFLFQMLSSENLQKAFKDQMSGNAITRTTLTKINSTQIAIPKVEEQDRIISILENCDKSLLKEKENLMKIQSIKTALMQDLLTGKVSVDNLIKANLWG